MDAITIGGACVHLDFLLRTDLKQVGIVSYYDRSLSLVKSFAAGLSLVSTLCYNHDTLFLGGEFETFIQPVSYGKEKFYHAISISKGCGVKYMVYNKKNSGRTFYDFLMKNFNLPLMESWGDAMFEYFLTTGRVSHNSRLEKGDNSVCCFIPMNGKQQSIDNLSLSEVSLTEEELKEGISQMLRNKWISITDEPQVKLQFSNMDDYFKKYGPTLVKNLEETITPLRQLDGEAHDFTLNEMRLYPQQLAQINGDVALLERGKYAILNHGMGTGKTITAPSVAESFFVRKYLRSHPKESYADAYKEPGLIKYRNIIMCPGHLVQKWADEISRQVPYAKVTVLKEFSQLVDIRRNGSKRRGKEYFILSKDFCKLSFQSVPSPTKSREGILKDKECAECGKSYNKPENTCPSCGSHKVILRPRRDTVTGMVCPHCNNVLIPYEMWDATKNLDPGLKSYDFGAQNTRNSRCYYCNEELWQPYVVNIGNVKSSKWTRATYYANKAHKGKKTVWVHKDFMDESNIHMGETPISVMDRKGSRKYAPAEFIKRYLKGYFDIAIFDEIQDLKGGFTGQGHAMHALIKASKKQMALTGTIAGGMANHLFYTLFRLDPKRMVDRGFKYTDELAFSKAYGKVETSYEYSGSENESYLSSCKGKQKAQPKVKPGISPLIFMDFLLDRTTFLDLSDMSKYLPKFVEKVVSVEPQMDQEDLMMEEYRRVIDNLTGLSKQKGGMAMLSNMLQFSLSYLDKPYGVGVIKSPVSGEIVEKPKNFKVFEKTDNYDELLSKEKKLIELIRSEQAEGRNVVIYCEYTASAESCITYRLQEIIEKYCNLKGKVAVLESSSPQASKREEWMHKKAKEGVKVFITNPRCVATGLDFCFTMDGVAYNYPTLIFYQLGYSLFTTWQASRRAFRLNQTKECRTYYMAWAGSTQEAVISLIAEKQAATSAIQGKFSTEGLAAMANGVDSRMKLAQAMSNMDSITGNGLQEMFDVLGADNGEDTSYSSYKPMLLFKELIGEEAAPEGDFDTVKTGQLSLLDLVETLSSKKEEKKAEEDNIAYVSVTSSIPVAKPVLTVLSSQTKSRKKIVSGQFSLF